MGRCVNLLLLLAFIYLPVQSKLITCGGFVKSFNTDIFSKIKVHFLNNEGHLKYETDVSPSGYYMIPVYKKDSYVIKIEGPEGFVFNPAKIQLTINEEDDPCTKGIDNNFELFGFAVNGKVRSGDLAGPSRLNLGLFSEDNQLYASTFTTESGEYHFEASPGKYVVSTIDNTQQCVERGSVPIEVKDRPVTVVPDIRISGHSLIISVNGESNSPLSGATILLISDQNIPFDQQINAAKPTVTKKGNKWEYRLLTDKSGKATFTCLPPNKYELTPSWSTKKTSLSFSPPKHTVEIGSEVVELEFKTDGFDVVGQVQIGKKQLNEVNIFVDGKQLAETDKEGIYRIKALKPGRHTFEAKKEHFYFEKLSHEINIDNPTLPLIQAKKLQVCGSVKFDNSNNHVNQETTINVIDGPGGLVEKLHIDKNGKFCTLLQPGTYTIKPSQEESRVKPDLLKIELKDEPILDLIFTEFKATVNGRLECFSQGECSNAKVHLILNGREVDSTSIQGNSFVFNDVLPGTYSIKISYLDTICLAEEKKSITIESTNPEISFKQIGYRAKIHSPIDLILNWKHSSGVGGSRDLNAGENSFCLPKAGDYTVNFDTCHEFAQGKTINFNLPLADVLSLTVKSSYFSSSIQTETNTSPNDFKLQLISSQGDLNLSPTQNSQSRNHSFTTFIAQELGGQEIELRPKSEKFLFVPTQHKFTFNGECSFNKLVFKAVEGKYVSGTIEPAVSNVAVTATHKQDGTVLNAKTDSKGNFKIGLVFNPDDYNVEFELEGFKFTPTGTKNKFKSIKLSKLVVAYFDKATKKSLSDVLISLSGGENYRENKVVNSDGKMTFVGLPAGEYFVRSVLREYQFDPVTSSVKINEGETIELNLYGNRYAYSAFGKVSTAGGGHPSNQMNVEAVSKNCGKLQEDDTTNEKGEFRVRGLKPKCTYTLSLRSTDGTQISSIPPFIEIVTEEKDTTELDFTILATVPLNEIVGVVQFDEVSRPKSLRVELYENGVYKTNEELTTGSLFIFSNVIMPSNTYKISINDADLKNMHAVSEPIEFVASQLTKHLILRVKLRERRPEIETSKSSFFGIIFVLLSTFFCLNVNYSKELLLSLADRTRTIINQQRESSPGAQKRKAKRN